MILLYVDIYIYIHIAVVQKFCMNYTPPDTNMSPENGWLEYDRFLFGPGPFSGANC